jgi:hypothetical protein
MPPATNVGVGIAQNVNGLLNRGAESHEGEGQLVGEGSEQILVDHIRGCQHNLARVDASQFCEQGVIPNPKSFVRTMRQAED